MVDDSIVRGTTCREIVQMARCAGANKVYVASAAPEIRYPNVYGIDMPTAQELVAHNKNTDEICQAIGTDWLIYQDLNVIVDAVHEGNPKVTDYEKSVFTGKYITGDIDPAYMQQLADSRKDSVRFGNTSTEMENIDIHNHD